MNNKIAVLGGDKRQLFAADELRKAGFEVFLAGFDKLKSVGELRLCTVFDALDVCGVVILPVTGVKNGKIPCPFGEDIPLKEIDDKLIDKLVIMGKSETLQGVKTVDILKRGGFSELNALPSAEGALLVAMQSFEGNIAGSDTLVIGYGRIGARLSEILRAMKARVTVSTRSKEKACKISLDGNTPIYTDSIDSLSGFNIVFNTADAPVIDRTLLQNSDSDTLIIDLSSSGGVDFNSARELGFTAIHALALPGKYSPASAGKAISDTVLNIIKEEFSWQKLK